MPALPFEIDLQAIYRLPPEEQEEELARFQVLQRALEANPLWRFLPHEGEKGFREEHNLPLSGQEGRGQVEFLELTPRGVYKGAVVAGNRFGKTHINVADALIQTLPYDLVPPWLQPFKVLDPSRREVRVRFCGVDGPNWLATVLKPKFRMLIPPAALWKQDLDRAWNEKERILRFADGSWWNVLTYEMPLGAWGGADVDRVAFDEEPRGELGKQQFQESIGRVIDRDGDIRFTLTPVQGIGWLFEELSDEHGEPRRDDEVYVVSGDIDHNPHISEKGRRRAIAEWSKDPATAQARRKGLWVHREGLIFPEFRRQPEEQDGAGGHLRPDRPLHAPGAPSPRAEDGTWRVPVFEAIDPGINVDHPFAFVVAFLNDRATDLYGQGDVLEVFVAHKEPELIVAQQAEIIRETRLRFGYQPSFTVIDPAAQNRNPATGKKLQDAFREQGVYAIPGQNDRALTYEQLRARVVTHRLRVWQSLDAGLGDEFSNYRWKRPRGQTDDVAKPEPIKRNDDLIDALRYLCVRIPVWRGDRPERKEDDAHPRAQLLRDHIHRLTARRGAGKRIGGVW